MNENDFTLIDNYYNGLLSEEEAQAVRNRTNSDPEFAREFVLRNLMEKWLEHNPQRTQLAARLSEIGDSYFQEEKQAPVSGGGMSVIWRKRALLAAAVTLFLAAIWFVFSPKPSLYDQYAQHAPLSLSYRGNVQSDVTAAETAFNKGDYAAALQALDRVIAAEPDNNTARLYKAICLIELNRSAEARDILAPLAAGTTAFRNDAVWYVALSYLKENKTEEAKQSLRQIQGGDHFEQAQEILNR